AGLGLAICKKLMTLLNSDLRVESQLGKGTCFSFELTLANSH
ncbi:ATP-binding protein, partial [Alteromonas stellipolaris]